MSALHDTMSRELKARIEAGLRDAEALVDARRFDEAEALVAQLDVLEEELAQRELAALRADTGGGCLSKYPIGQVRYQGGPLDGVERHQELYPTVTAAIEIPSARFVSESDPSQVVTIRIEELVYVLHQMSDGTYRYVVRGQQP